MAAASVESPLSSWARSARDSFDRAGCRGGQYTQFRLVSGTFAMSRSGRRGVSLRGSSSQITRFDIYDWIRDLSTSVEIS